MTIDNQSLDKRLNQLADINLEKQGTELGNLMFNEADNTNANFKPITDVDAQAMPEDVTPEEPIMVAGKVPVESIRRILKESLEQKGARTQREIKVTPGTQRPKSKTAVMEEDITAIPDEPQPLSVKPITEGKAQKILDRKESLTGGPRGVPSPTPGQTAQGIEQTAISNISFDEESLSNTVRASSEVLLNDRKVSTMSVESMYQEAVKRGVPETLARSFLQGTDFSSKVGDSELAVQMAGLIKLHDDSAVVVDNLFTKLTDTGLNDVEKLELRQQLAYHNIILKKLSNAQTDVARTMNTFKRAKDTGPALNKQEFQAILDETGDESVLLDIAEKYNLSKSRSAKNKLIDIQDGTFTKLKKTVWYTFQSNLLNDPATSLVNVVSSAVHGGIMLPENFIAKQFGKFRGAAPEEYAASGSVSTLHALLQGSLDGLESGLQVWKTGKRAGYKSDISKVNPMSSEYWEIKNTLAGKIVDGIGYVTSIPFRGLGSGDEVASGTFARIALHDEASKFIQKRMGELTDEGMDLATAEAQVMTETKKFLTEQPADIYANVEEVRKMVSFSYDWDKTYMLDKAYSWMGNIGNVPILRGFAPFANTTLKIMDQGAARVPGMNFLSPQYHKDVARGGIYADRAYARLALGSTISGFIGYKTLEDGTFTGSGPKDPALRQSLERTGWQKYSMVFNEGDFTPAQIDRLKNMTDVSLKDGRYYISYARFEPIAQILAAGADFGDAMKFYRGDLDDEKVQNFATAVLGTTAEYVSNMPTLQTIDQIVSLARYNQEDKGEQLVLLLESIGSKIGQNIAIGTPVVGLTMSTAASHAARLIDKEKRSKLPDEMFIGNTDSANRFYQQAKNELLARIPVVRGYIDQELDSVGRPVFSHNTVMDAYANGIPFINKTYYKPTELDQVLVENWQGIEMPSKMMEGVYLSDKQYNAFKKLYGQEIKLPYLVGNDFKNMNLEEAIPYALKNMDADRLAAGLGPAQPGDKRNKIKELVGKYRSKAKERMLGISTGSEAEDYENRYTGIYYDNDGNEQPAIFKELADSINKRKKFVRESNNPR
jgi:hypothetical protein